MAMLLTSAEVSNAVTSIWVHKEGLMKQREETASRLLNHPCNVSAWGRGTQGKIFPIPYDTTQKINFGSSLSAAGDAKSFHNTETES